MQEINFRFAQLSAWAQNAIGVSLQASLDDVLNIPISGWQHGQQVIRKVTISVSQHPNSKDFEKHLCRRCLCIPQFDAKYSLYKAYMHLDEILGFEELILYLYISCAVQHRTICPVMAYHQKLNSLSTRHVLQQHLIFTLYQLSLHINISGKENAQENIVGKSSSAFLFPKAQFDVIWKTEKTWAAFENR